MTRDTFWAWYQAGRPPFFVATLIPLCLGGAVAYVHGYWDTVRWSVVLLGSFLVHLCTNLANDYFDYVSGADAGDSLGGSRVLHQGKLSLVQLRNALIILYGCALLCGIWIIFVSQVWWLIAFMVFAFFSSLFYTAPPLRYGYLGLGEIFVGINMGPVMVVGTTAVLSETFLPMAFWVSLPIAFMVSVILYYQSLPDIEADRAIGKQTIAARIGAPQALWGVRFLAAMTFCSITVLVAYAVVSSVALISLAGIFQVYQIDKMIRSSTDWKDLHDRGERIRILYLFVGVTLIVSVLCNQ